MLNIALVFLGFLLLTVIGGVAGGGTVITSIEQRFSGLATRAEQAAEKIRLTKIIPALRRLSWMAVALFALDVLTSFILACAVKNAPFWNILVVIVISAIFSIWIVLNAWFGTVTVKGKTFNRDLADFSAESLWNAIVLGFISMGMVEFLIGNACHARALVMLGAINMMVGFAAFLTVVVGAVWLMAKGMHIAEQVSTLLCKLAVSIAKNGKAALASIDVQFAAEESWVPRATQIVLGFMLPVLPAIIVGILMPSMALQSIVWCASFVGFLLLVQLEAVKINTESRRQNAVLMLEKVVIFCLPIMALIILSPSGEAELDKLRDTFDAFASAVLSGTNAGMIKARASFIEGTIALVILYLCWSNLFGTTTLVRTRKIIGFLPFIAVLWCGGEIATMYFAPKLDTAVTLVKGKYFEKFVPKLSAEKVNDRKAVLVRWFEQPETDSYIVMRRGSEEKDQAVFHPILDPNFPGTDRPLVVSQGATQVYDYTAKPGEVYYYRVLALKYSAKPCWNAPQLGVIASFLGQQLVQAGARQPASCDTIESLIVHRSTETEIKVAEEKKAETSPAPTASAIVAVPTAVPVVTVARTSTPVAHAINRGYSPEMLEYCKLDSDACRP